MDVKIIVSNHGIPMVQVQISGRPWGTFPNMDTAIDVASSMVVPPFACESQEDAVKAAMAHSIMHALILHHNRMGLQSDTLRRCVAQS